MSVYYGGIESSWKRDYTWGYGTDVGSRMNCEFEHFRAAELTNPRAVRVKPITDLSINCLVLGLSYSRGILHFGTFLIGHETQCWYSCSRSRTAK